MAKSMLKSRKKLSDAPRQKIGGRGFFDAAATTHHNQKHWSQTSTSDYDTLVRQDRQTLCQRAVYEVANSGYFKGILNTLANDLVGVGPRLQLDSGNIDFDAECENKFQRWARRCDFFGQLNLAGILRMSGATEFVQKGESITILQSEPKAGLDDVSLRLAVVATERLANPLNVMDSESFHDGIQYDSFGRPQTYCILKTHPGASWMTRMFEYDMIPADRVIHLFIQEHPGQTRGVPWISSSLPTGAQKRRFGLATVDAAETAANIAGTIQTRDTAIDDSTKLEDNDVIDIERNALLTLPEGYEAKQFDPKQPATTYEMFTAELINEMARPLNMPYNVAACNSKNYNYASGRLDHQEYDKSNTTIQSWIAQMFLNRVFAAWLTEAYMLPNYFDARPSFDEFVQAMDEPQWFWTPRKHVDPAKESDAEEKNLSNASTTLSTCYGEKGKDWQREVRQWIREIKYIIDTAAEIGVPLELALPSYLKLKLPAQPAKEPDDEPATKS